MNTDFHQYLIKIQTDPGCYGDECTPEQARLIAQSLAALVARQFPGIVIHLLHDQPEPQVILGPDPDVVSHIAGWLGENWWQVLPQTLLN